MPSYLPMSEIRAMTYEDLERWWEVDFDVLTSTAVAEATGDVHQSVSEALRSDDWLEQWADALYAATGELKSSVERMQYTGDERLARTVERSGLVAQRVGHVNRLLRERRSAEGWEMAPSHQKDAYTATLAILAKHYAEEAWRLRDEEVARRGLPPNPPSFDTDYADKFDAIEDGVRREMLHAPLTAEVRALLQAPAHVLVDRVAKDASTQEDRCAELRHPLLLRGWASSLKHLRDQNCELAGIAPAWTVDLPKLDRRQIQTLSEQEAWGVINRRRFIRALAQRNRECEMHVRQVVRAVSVRMDEIEEPWRDAVAASREELGRRHPDEMKALLSAFEPFCHPGTTEIRRNQTGRNGFVPKELIPALKKALTDGTWRRFLGEKQSAD